MMENEIIISKNSDGTIYKTYYERKIGKTLYRITSTYLGKFELQPALENLTVRKVLKEINKI